LVLTAPNAVDAHGQMRLVVRHERERDRVRCRLGAALPGDGEGCRGGPAAEDPGGARQRAARDSRGQGCPYHAGSRLSDPGRQVTHARGASHLTGGTCVVNLTRTARSPQVAKPEGSTTGISGRWTDEVTARGVIAGGLSPSCIKRACTASVHAATRDRTESPSRQATEPRSSVTDCAPPRGRPQILGRTQVGGPLADATTRQRGLAQPRRLLRHGSPTGLL